MPTKIIGGTYLPSADTASPDPTIGNETVGSFNPNVSTISPTAQDTLHSAMTYGLPGIGVGFLDTLGQSIGVLHNDTMPKFLQGLTGTGNNSFGDFYAQHQEGLRTGGDLAGMLIPGLVAMKALKTVKLAREAGQLGELAKNSRALDILLGNSADLTALEGKVGSAADDALKNQGVFTGRDVGASPEVINARRSYYAARAVESVRSTAAFEFGNRIAFNSSSTFYPADYTLTDQILWGAGGLGVGAGLDFAAAKYATRNIIAAATAKAGTLGEIERTTGPLSQYASNVIFRKGDRGVGITVFAGMKADLEARAKVNVNSTFQTNVAGDKTGFNSILLTQASRLALDTNPLVPRSNLDAPQLQLFLKALDKDTTAFVAAKKLGQLPDSPQTFYAKMQEKLDGAKANLAKLLNDPKAAPKDIDAARQEHSDIIQAANQNHYVIENTGDWSLFRTRAQNWLDDNSYGDIKRQTYNSKELDVNGQETNFTRSKLTAHGDNDIVLHDDFRLEMPDGATPLDWSAYHAMASKFINDYRPVKGQAFILTPKLPWRAIEGTLALADAHQQAQSFIKLGGGFQTLDDARFHVVNEKFKEFLKLMPDTAAPVNAMPDVNGFAAVAARVKSNRANFTPNQVISMLNLPPNQYGKTAPLIEAFAHGKLQNMTDLNDMFPRAKSLTPGTSQWDLLNQHLRQTAGMAADAEQDVATSGPFLNQPVVLSDPKLPNSKTFAKPLFVAADALPYGYRVDTEIGAKVQATRQVQLQRLAQIDAKVSPLVQGVIGRIINANGSLPLGADTARAVQSLQDGMTGSGQIVYQERINDQFPALKAMQLIAQHTDQFSKSYAENLFKTSGMSDKISEIFNPKNKADLLDFNRIEQAYRHGYDIKGLKQVSGGGYAFELNKSEINDKLHDVHFGGDEETDNGLLPDMSVTALRPQAGSNVSTRKPLIVSKMAAELAQTISEISRQSGNENNALRSSLGSAPIRLRDFHLPTPELSQENAWFVRNSSGRVMATFSSPDSTNVSNRARAQQAASILSERFGDQHTAVPIDNIRRDHQMLDDHFFNLIDYSDQLAKTGKGILGGLAHTTVDTGPSTLKSMAESLQSQFLNIGVRARAAIFEPELNYAKQAAVAGQAGDKKAAEFNVFNRYIATAFSRNPSYSDKLGISAAYTTAESWLDNQISWLGTWYDSVGNQDTAFSKVARTIMRKQTPEEEYNQFKNTLPSWSPFTDAEKFAESTFGEKTAWSARGFSSSLTRLSTTVALRVMDMGTVINNYAGLVSNMPSVIVGLRQLPNESREQWLNRTAAWSSEMKDGIATWSSAKATRTAFSAMWDPAMKPIIEDAVKSGYLKPEYASLSRALNVQKSTNIGKAYEEMMRLGTTIVDQSEIHVRKTAWVMGYKIAKDLHGMENPRDAYLFANNFVNETIGNYSTNNRPAMFSGALGAPIGAFQTYFLNFYRRLYGMVERQDKAGLIAQYATLASVFGAKSVPGYAAWNNMFQTNHTDPNGDDFTGRINRNLPSGVGELVLNGTLSNIPKIWGGLQASGLSFYTRGGMDLSATAVDSGNLWHSPVPTVADLNRTPPAQFLARIAEGMKGTFNNVFSNEHFSIQEQENILAGMSTNRLFRSVMEMAANADVDNQGRVIDYGTRDAIHTAASLLGARPSYVASAQEAMAKNRQIQLSQENLRTILNEKTRALFRGGEFKVDDMRGIAKDYINAGGNPGYLGEWLRNQFMTSMTPKALTQLQSEGKSGKLQQFEDTLAALQQNQDLSAINKRNGH